MERYWKGRFDSNEDLDLRIWQTIKNIKEYKNGRAVAFIGYDTDDGVARNQGRVGARLGSNAIRKAMQSFPIMKDFKIYDYLNLNSFKMEEAQKEYSEKVADAINKNIFPIGLGGGHDIAYGSYWGVRKAFPEKRIGIINFDSHLDMRPYDKSPNSGTMFKQILDRDKNVDYMIVGFQDSGNTKRIVDSAKEYNVKIIKEGGRFKEIIPEVLKFLKENDVIYVTFCMDVFDISDAPGVSAPSAIGLDKKIARDIFIEILKDGKVVCTDFAEVNPSLDIDDRTSRLAGRLAYEIILNEKRME
ncbi:MAG: formimidoylglutamase [Fusobacteriaceae bacterium]